MPSATTSDAAWIAGVDVARLKIQAYRARRRACRRSPRWSGSASTARRAATTPTASILFVVTAVVLGGVDINGGRGSILGVVLALFLLGTLRNGMGLANIAGPTQTVVLGALLIVGVLRPVDRHARSRHGRARLAPGRRGTSS